MKIAIVGTGAVGGYYGTMLAQSGQEVHFLLNSDYLHVRDHGLLLETAKGNILLNPVNAWESAHKMPKCDLIIIALKTTANHLLANLIAPLYKSDSTILVLQNGIDVEKDIASIVPRSCTVLGGLCTFACNKIGPGHIRHINYNSIQMAQYTDNGQAAGITETLTDTAHVFEKAGIPIDLHLDLEEARWRKLLWNIPYNGLATILGSNTKLLMQNPETRKLIKCIMKEVQQAAHAHGKIIEDSFIEHMLEITDKMSPYQPSMKLDYDAKRELEIVAIYKQPIHKAKKLNCAMPLVESLYSQLSYLSQQQTKH